MNEAKPQGAQPASPPKDDEGGDPARNLQSIFSRRLLTALAVLSFVVALALFLLGIFRPDMFRDAFARFAFCGALSVYAGIFLFVLYPSRIELLKVPLLNIELNGRVVGPAALILILFPILWKNAPLPPTGRLFEVTSFEGAGDPPYKAALTKIKRRDGGPSVRTFVIPENLQGDLGAVYIEFPYGENKVDARMHYGEPPNLRYDVTFERGAEPSAITVTWEAIP